MTILPHGRLPLILTLSVLINMLLMGFLLGGEMATRTNTQDRPTVETPGMAIGPGFLLAVPEADRPAVRRAFRDAFWDTRLERRTFRRAKRALEEAVLTEPYDRDAALTAFTSLRQAKTALDRRYHHVLADQFGRLSLSQRRALLNPRSRGPGSRLDRPATGERGPPRREREAAPEAD